MPQLTESDLTRNKSFLDNVALETMKIFIQNRNPQNFGDSVQVSRIAYRQALAMLQTRKNLDALLQEVETFKNDGRKPIRSVENRDSGGDTEE